MNFDKYQRERLYNLEKEAREAASEAKDAATFALHTAERAENAADILKQLLDEDKAK